METKTCTKCLEQKPLSEFSKNKATSDGLERWCRKCKAEAGAALRAKRNGQAPETVTVTLDKPAPRLNWKEDALSELRDMQTKIVHAIEVIQGME